MDNRSLLTEAYQNKKVFMTGHTGFKGSWLTLILHQLGANIKGYALEPQHEHDLYHLIRGDQLCESVIGDIRDSEKLCAEIRSFMPDYIFHLAAQPLVRLSYSIPEETFATNVMGTCNVLEGLRQLPHSCNAVFITTDKVYQNYEWIYPYRETDKLGGHDPYSSSKACSELVISCYRNAYFNTSTEQQYSKAVAVARAGNVIGGGDWSKDRLIPDIIRSLMKEEKIIIRHPDSIRPWQHVLEPLFGYLLLGSKLASDPESYSQAYNFGPYYNDMLPVYQVVQKAILKWGKGTFEVRKEKGSPHEANLLMLDISKAMRELNWRPALSMEDALSMTLEWYRCYAADPVSIVQKTKQQIMYFLNSAHICNEAEINREPAFPDLQEAVLAEA